MKILYEIAYLRALKIWRQGQLNQAQTTMNKIKKDETKKQNQVA